MTKVIIETAAFADAVKNANIVAPSRGKAYDQSAGIIVETDKANNAVIVRSTNGEVWYREWVTATSIEGDDVSWRLSSEVFAPLVGAYPIGSGKTITLEEVTTGHNKSLVVVGGKSKSKLNLMLMDLYPDWEVFDPDGLVVVNELGTRVKMVDWAAGFGDAGTALVGVHFDGATVRATDRYKLAVAPLKLPEDAAVPATVPAGMLGRLLKQTGEVRVTFTENHMLLMPNESTQIKMVIIGLDYPPTSRLEKRQYPETVSLDKEVVIAAVNRALIAAPSDRQPLLEMYVGSEEVSFRVGTDNSTIIDTIEVPGQATHRRFLVHLTPKPFLEAVTNAPGMKFSMSYNPEDNLDKLYVVGEGDYEVWVMPRRQGS